jgi:DME family drug/metabolite transporter
MFLFSLISFLIPHFFYFVGVKEIPASTAGIILLLEPLAGAILAALFLSQAITINVFIGGLFILAANYLVIKYEPNQEILPETEGIV